MSSPSFSILTAAIVLLTCNIESNAGTIVPDSGSPLGISQPEETKLEAGAYNDEIYDLCIIGAGMFGSAAARHASEISGIKICLIGPDEPTPEEEQTREIFASYYDEARIVQVISFDVPCQKLAIANIGRFRKLEGLSGIPFYSPVGVLWLSKKDTDFTEKVVVNRIHMSNLPVVDMSYNDTFQKRFPYIKKEDDAYVHLEDFGAGILNPRNFVAASRKVAQIQGCTLIKKIVEEVKPLKNGIHKIITEDGKIVKARKVLFCTGVYTNLKKFPMPKLKIDLYKATAVLFKLPMEEVQRLSAMPAIIYERPEDMISVYILPPVQYPDGNYYIKIGPDLFDDGSKPAKTIKDIREWYLNTTGSPIAVKYVTKILLDVLPGLKYEATKINTCVTCGSPNGIPYIDRVTPTVTVAAVGNGVGARVADEVGRLGAVYSVTGKWDSEVPRILFRFILDNDNPREPIV